MILPKGDIDTPLFRLPNWIFFQADVQDKAGQFGIPDPPGGKGKSPAFRV